MYVKLIELVNCEKKYGAGKCSCQGHSQKVTWRSFTIPYTSNKGPNILSDKLIHYSIERRRGYLREREREYALK